MKNRNGRGLNRLMRDESGKYAYLKNLDSARLQALLLQESLLADEDSFDSELVRQISVLLDGRDPVFEDFDVKASLTAFKEEIAPCAVWDGDLEEAEDAEKKRKRRGVMKILVAAVLAVLLGSTLVAGALGYDVWEAVVSWGKETFRIGAGGESTGGADSPAIPESGGTVLKSEATNFKSAEEAAKAFSACAQVPKWVPDGFELKQASVLETPGHRCLLIVYQSAGGMLTFNADEHEGGEPAYFYEKNAGDGETAVIGGRECYFMSNYERSCVVWVVDNCVYSISGDVSREDLLRMVGSI